MADDTVFDKILRKEIPAKVVFENDHVLAFRDIEPKAPVHVVVIPKVKARNVSELAERNPAEAGEFIKGIARTALQLGLQEKGYRVVMNTGPDALQSVEYLHAHIIAGRVLSWPPG